MRWAPLAKLRDAGWMVAVHNDYRQDGKLMTFWLFTHPQGCWVKGEGETDAEALEQCQRAADDIRKNGWGSFGPVEMRGPGVDAWEAQQQ